LNFSDRGDGYLVTEKDVKEKLNEIGYQLKKGDIVLIQSGAGEYSDSEEFLIRGCGMSRAATNYITGFGVKVVGTDAWSWDRPLPIVNEEFARTKDKSIIWEGHYASLDRGYCHMEKLENLDKLPETGFIVVCFPIKIEGASAAWVRPVAIIKD